MKIGKIPFLRGELSLGGDKSISHRAVIFASMAEGVSVLSNVSAGADVKSTIKCFMQLGVEITETSPNCYSVNGNGIAGLKEPIGVLDAGNSGTTSRLLMGLLSAKDFHSTITGDESLSKRPMLRVVTPLRELGNKITTSESGTLPVLIEGSSKINPFTITTMVPSAQVKSALLLYGLHSDTECTVIENELTRNHTELMLGLSSLNTTSGYHTKVSRKNYPVCKSYAIPADISSAAFYIVKALITPKSDIIIKNVSLNETRIEFLRILQDMGGDILINPTGAIGLEPIGDIRVKSSYLKNVDIRSEQIASIIDEIPILSIAGLFAEGDFIIRNARELRVKESDRIEALCSNFKTAGLGVEEYNDGFCLSGIITKKRITFDSFDDHRIAMSFAILSTVLKDGAIVNGMESVAISNPLFLSHLKELSHRD